MSIGRRRRGGSTEAKPYPNCPHPVDSRHPGGLGGRGSGTSLETEPPGLLTRRGAGGGWRVAQPVEAVFKFFDCKLIATLDLKMHRVDPESGSSLRL
jgi:hypothetical protein